MRVALVLLFSLFIAACGDLWFKPGSNNDELALDKAECDLGLNHTEGARGERDRRFEQCMAEKGWWHSDAASRQAAAHPPPAATASAALPAPAPRSEPSTPAPPGTGAVAPRSTDSGTGEPPAPAVATQTASEPDYSAAVTANLHQSWWKRGGRDIDLARDQKNCREKSGVELPAGTPYRWGESAGFDQCMRDLGWRGP